MLRKLLKYDFRSMGKRFALIWPAALAIGLLNRFTTPWNGGDGMDIAATRVISVLLLVAVMVTMAAVALVFIIQRFYKGLLGDEGYLMHTLPVRPWQLIASKLICALAVVLLSGVTAALTLAIMVPLEWWSWAAEAVNDLWENLGGLSYVVGWLLMALTGMVQSLLMLYLSMALGHLFSKCRAGMSVAAFIVLSVLNNTLVGRIRATVMIGINAWSFSWTGIWINIIVSLVLCVVFFAGTEYILRKKLNLE
jgi:hypothetical protein